MKTQPARNHDGRGRQWSMLALCAVCLVPLVLVAGAAVLGGAALGFGGYALFGVPLALLLCPLVMAAMMLLMGRSHGRHDDAACHDDPVGRDARPTPPDRRTQ